MQFHLIIISLIFFIFCNTKVSEIKQQAEQKTTIDTSTNNIYSWNKKIVIQNKLINRIAVPKNYKRINVAKNSFEDWLRNIPIKTGNPPVYLYNGKKKNNQTAQYAVIDMDVGNKNLQQCADAVIRLRAEYLFSSNKKEDISFKFTSGDKCSYLDWCKGIRPIISANKVYFSKTKNTDNSYTGFKNYLQTIFNYCGTFSLEKELKKVSNIQDIKAGDVFIMGGFPGHAVIVMDVAINNKTNEKIFLLAQSYMPAQDMHILKNPLNSSLSPWFSINFGETLTTPEWTFEKNTLKSF